MLLSYDRVAIEEKNSNIRKYIDLVLDDALTLVMGDKCTSFEVKDHEEELFKGEETMFIRHFKGGWYTLYDDFDRTILSCEDKDKLILYKQVKTGDLYARPNKEFISKIDTQKHPSPSQPYRLCTVNELLVLGYSASDLIAEFIEESKPNKKELELFSGQVLQKERWFKAWKGAN